MENKNLLKKKGTATINLLTGDVNFSAYNEGGGTAQKNVVKAGDAKLYETEGEKQSSICAHLRVSSLVADPRAELQEQLDAVLRKAGYKEEPEGLLKPQVKCLERSKVLTIWHDKKKRKVVVQMVIDTEVNTTLEQPLYQLAQMTVKCFAINERSLSGETEGHVTSECVSGCSTSVSVKNFAESSMIGKYFLRKATSCE